MERFMKGVAVTAPGEATVVRDLPLPEPDEYGCLVRIRCCAYSALTDGRIIDNAGRDRLPLIPGRGGVASVVSVGRKVRYIRKGDRFLSPRVSFPQGYSAEYGNFSAYGTVTDVKAMLEDGLEPSAVPDGTCFPMTLPLSDSDAAMLPVIAGVISAVREAGVGKGYIIKVTGASSEARIAKDFLRLVGDEHAERPYGAQKASAEADGSIDGNSYALTEERAAGPVGGLCDVVIDFDPSGKDSASATAGLKNGGAVVTLFPEREYGAEAEVKNVSGLPFDLDSQKLAGWLVGEGMLRPSDYYSDIMPVEFIGECIRLNRENEVSTAVLSI